MGLRDIRWVIYYLKIKEIKRSFFRALVIVGPPLESFVGTLFLFLGFLNPKKNKKKFFFKKSIFAKMFRGKFRNFSKCSSWNFGIQTCNEREYDSEALAFLLAESWVPPPSLSPDR